MSIEHDFTVSNSQRIDAGDLKNMLVAAGIPVLHVASYASKGYVHIVFDDSATQAQQGTDTTTVITAYFTQQTASANASAARAARIVAKRTAMKNSYNGSTYASLNTAQKTQFREDFILYLAEQNGWLDANGVITIPNGS